MATILIAEDDHAISDLVAYNLERAGHTPLAAYDGLTALEVARRDKPELILLDQMMPGMDGPAYKRTAPGQPHPGIPVTS
ncbi:MAG: response regulator [Akkermansia muciniphila]